MVYSHSNLHIVKMAAKLKKKQYKSVEQRAKDAKTGTYQSKTIFSWLTPIFAIKIN